MSAPRLEVRAGDCRADGARWSVEWRVRNAGAAVVLESARLPHARFRAAERALGLALAAGGETSFALSVATRGEAGEHVAENPFLILRVAGAGERWRVLARLSLRFDDAGRPRPAVAVVTSQRVGFSGVEE